MEEVFEIKSVPIRLLLKPELNNGLENIIEDLEFVSINKSKLIEIAISNFIKDYSSFIHLIDFSREFNSKLDAIEELEKLEDKK